MSPEDFSTGRIALIPRFRSIKAARVMRMPSTVTHARLGSKTQRRSHSASTKRAVSVMVILASVTVAHAQSNDVTAALEIIREKRKVPALAAAAMKDGKLVAIGATGLRRLGGKERVTVEDKWHIGSCTKSMTASVAARLVERGLLKW